MNAEEVPPVATIRLHNVTVSFTNLEQFTQKQFQCICAKYCQIAGQFTPNHTKFLAEQPV